MAFDSKRLREIYTIFWKDAEDKNLSKFDASEYLDDPETAAEYLELALNESDELFDVMLDDILRAQKPAQRKQTFKLFFNRQSKV